MNNTASVFFDARLDMGARGPASLSRTSVCVCVCVCVCGRILFGSLGPRNPTEPRPPCLAHLKALTMRARDPFVLFCLAEIYSRGYPHVRILTVSALYCKDRLRNRDGGEGDRQLPKYPNLPQLRSRMTERRALSSSADTGLFTREGI